VPFGGFTKKVVRVTRLKTVAIAIFFLTLGPASVYAQAPSQAPTEGRSPLSEIAHDVSNWFTRVIGTDGSRHREGSLPARSVTPLPRPRPTKLTSVPVAPNTSKPVAESVPLNNEPSELTTSSVPTNKESLEPTTSPVPPNKEPSEHTAAPVAPKKKAPVPVLIND